MGFGSFLRGVAAQVNPWDHGATYGTYNPSQKKRQDDYSAPATPAPRQISAPNDQNYNQNQNPNQLQAKKPTNLFTSLNNDLKLPSSPQNTTTINPIHHQIDQGLNAGKSWEQIAHENNLDVNMVKQYSQATRPNYGVTPTPHNFLQKLGSGLKTAGQTAIGTVSNLPEVGLGAVRVGTGIIEGATQLPSMATHALTYAPRKIFGDDSSVTHALNSLNSGVDKATHFIDRPINYINRGLDIAAKKYETNVPTAYGGDQVYKSTQVPLNVLAALLTLGGSTAAEGASAAGEAGQAGRVGQVLNTIRSFANKPLTSNPDNLISRTGQTVTKRTAPVVHAVNSPFRSTSRAIGNTINNMRSLPAAERDIVVAGEAGNAGSVPIPVRTPQSPLIQDVSGIDTAPGAVPPGAQVPTSPVPTITTPQPIKELAGDKPGQTMPTPADIARRNFDNQPKSRSDQKIEGVTSRPGSQPFKISDVHVKTLQDHVVNEYAKFLKDFGEGNGTQLVPDGTGGYVRTSNNYRPGMGKGRVTKQQWIDKARQDLESGNAEEGHQRMFNDAANPDVQSLLTQGDTSVTAPTGRPISVKQVTGIPVVDKTVDVPPANLPETPGTVRPTAATAPANAEAAAVAAQPKVAPEALLPAETKAVLANPKQFSKAQVAAARNQLKLAKKMAKTYEDTNAAMERINTARPTSDKGFVPTGEFKQGVRGNVTEVAHQATENARGVHDAANVSTAEALTRAEQEISQHGSMSEDTKRILKSIRDSGQYPKSSVEYKAVNDAYENAISHHARGLALTDRVIRSYAPGEHLANRFTNKLLRNMGDTSQLTETHIKQVNDANNAFADARDAATAAGEKFKQTGSQEDFNAWKAAQQQSEKADRQARITEYKVAKEALKGNKNIEATKAIQDAEKNAGVYSMDAIDANMLSGTGTMVRNYINTLFPRIENKLFGRISTRAVKPIATVGGSSGRGARIGAKIGQTMFKEDFGARKEAGVGFIRRNVTAGNTIGERNIQATAYSKGFDHYKQVLKDEGYSGKELNNRAEYNVRTDPDGLVAQYEKDALQANALSGLAHNTKKVENVLADGIQKKLAGAGFGSTGQQVGRFGAKAVTRVGLGFPTVIARSLVEGVKRATLGIPEALWHTGVYLKNGNKEELAASLAKDIQHAGSGAALMTVGATLARMGVISGNYPTDPAERERWQAEGRQPNSINIGGQWFNIPGYFGGFSLPLMLGAEMHNGNIQDELSLKNAWNTVLSASPVDNIRSTLDIVTGNGSDAKVKNAVTSLVRSMTPAGSLVAEVAKLTDSTQNDTTTKDAIHNILDQVASGIPGLNNKVNTIDKTDAYGDVLHNPNKVATAFGAQGSEQKQGTQNVVADQTKADNTYKQLQDAGVIGDKNLTQLIDKKTLGQMQSGQPLKPETVKKVQEAVTKGITATEDSNWRENGQYATDKAALQVKLQMLNADPTTKPSEKKAYEIQIKRDDVLKDNSIAYDDFKLYKSTTLSDWRSMGNEKSENYDPDTYQKLWELDQLFQKAGASENSKDPAKQKFSAKEASTSTGRGRGGVRSYSPVTGEFGKLGSSNGAPSVQKYQTINQQAGNVPIIAAVRPNIVHNISSSG